MSSECQRNHIFQAVQGRLESAIEKQAFESVWLLRDFFLKAAEKNGYKKTAGTNWPFHPKTELIRGVMEEQCAQLMKDFFQSKR